MARRDEHGAPGHRRVSYATRGDGTGRLDVNGLVSSAAAIGVLVFTIIEAPSYGWASARSLAGFAAAAILLLVFVRSERRSPAPMIDVRIFRNRRFSAASGAVTVAFFTPVFRLHLPVDYSPP